MSLLLFFLLPIVRIPSGLADSCYCGRTKTISHSFTDVSYNYPFVYKHTLLYTVYFVPICIILPLALNACPPASSSYSCTRRLASIIPPNRTTKSQPVIGSFLALNPDWEMLFVMGKKKKIDFESCTFSGFLPVQFLFSVFFDARILAIGRIGDLVSSIFSLTERKRKSEVNGLHFVSEGLLTL